MRFTVPTRELAVSLTEALKTAGFPARGGTARPRLVARLRGEQPAYYVETDEAALPFVAGQLGAIGLSREALLTDTVRDTLEAVAVLLGFSLSRWAGLILYVHDERGEISFDVTNLLTQLVVAPAEQHESMAERFFASAATSDPGVSPTTIAETLTRLRPSLVPKVRIDSLWQRLPPEALKGFQLHASRLFADVHLMVSVDQGGSMRYLTGRDLEVLGMSFNSLGQLAVVNLAQLPCPPLEPLTTASGARLIRIASKDGYDSSRLLVRAVRDAIQAALGGPAVFAVPSRDELLAVRSDDPHAVQALAVEAEARLRSDGYPLSAALVVVREDGLHVFEHAGSAGPN